MDREADGEVRDVEQGIEHKVKELIRLSLDSSQLRVSFVVALLREGLFDHALDQSLPLIGTKHEPWFLYVQAWSCLARGSIQEARRVLGDAYRLLQDDDQKWELSEFSFTERGHPKLVPPFNSPLTYGDSTRATLPDDTDFLGFSTAMFREDWLALTRDIGENIREYKTVFKAVAGCIERVLHHDADTVGAAVGAAEIDDMVSARGNSFLLLTLLSEEHLQMVADTLWRVAADWNFPLSLCEVNCFLQYLLESDETALDLAERGLKMRPESIICGNVRALLLNRAGQVYYADEQWRQTLLANPDSSATYMVLGHQSICGGSLDVALRYFQEACILGDNPEEAERFLAAAMECLEE